MKITLPNSYCPSIVLRHFNPNFHSGFFVEIKGSTFKLPEEALRRGAEFGAVRIFRAGQVAGALVEADQLILTPCGFGASWIKDNQTNLNIMMDYQDAIDQAGYRASYAKEASSGFLEEVGYVARTVVLTARKAGLTTLANNTFADRQSPYDLYETLKLLETIYKEPSAQSQLLSYGIVKETLDKIPTYRLKLRDYLASLSREPAYALNNNSPLLCLRGLAVLEYSLLSSVANIHLPPLRAEAYQMRNLFDLSRPRHEEPTPTPPAPTPPAPTPPSPTPPVVTPNPPGPVVINKPQAGTPGAPPNPQPVMGPTHPTESPKPGTILSTVRTPDGKLWGTVVFPDGSTTWSMIPDPTVVPTPQPTPQPSPNPVATNTKPAPAGKRTRKR